MATSAPVNIIYFAPMSHRLDFDGKTYVLWVNEDNGIQSNGGLYIVYDEIWF